MPGRAGRSPHTSHVAQGLADTTRHLSCPEADCKRLGMTPVTNINHLDFYLGSVTLVKSFGSVSKPCTPVVHIKIAGKWMFIPLKMVFS